MSLSRGADVCGSGYGERPATDPGDYPSAERTNGGMSGHLCSLRHVQEQWRLLSSQAFWTS